MQNGAVSHPPHVRVRAITSCVSVILVRAVETVVQTEQPCYHYPVAILSTPVVAQNESRSQVSFCAYYSTQHNPVQQCNPTSTHRSSVIVNPASCSPCSRRTRWRNDSSDGGSGSMQSTTATTSTHPSTLGTPSRSKPLRRRSTPASASTTTESRGHSKCVMPLATDTTWPGSPSALTLRWRLPT